MLSRKKNHALSFPNILKFTRGKQLHIQSWLTIVIDTALLHNLRSVHAHNRTLFIQERY
jgi:hypothetical protein